MKELTFNKVQSKKAGGQVSDSIVFRKLKAINDKDRFQGNINKKGMDLISTINGDFSGVQILFSDEHAYIGFKPLEFKDKARASFGATELFRELNLKTGMHYDLTINGDVAIIDSNQFNN